MPSNPSDFKKLKAKWYKKLKKEGFTDIEDEYGNLNTYSSHFSEKVVVQRFKDREPYYYMATNFLNDYKFANRIEKIVWEYHTEGIGIRDIATLLKKARVATIKRDSIWKIITRLSAAMKAMYMSPDSHE